MISILFIDLHSAKSIFLSGDKSEILLIELFVVLLKLDPSIAESIEIEKVSIVSVLEKDIGEFDTGKDMLRSNLFGKLKMRLISKIAVVLVILTGLV